MPFDPNIFFKGLQAEQMKEQNLYDAISRGIGMAQQKRAMDIQERQLEAKKQPEFLDIVRASATKAAMGQELSPEEMGTVKAWQAMQRPTIDPVYGHVLGSPDIFSQLAPQATQQPMPPQQGFDVNKLMPPVPPVSMEQLGEMAQTPKGKMMAFEQELELQKQKKEKEATKLADIPRAESSIIGLRDNYGDIDANLDELVGLTDSLTSGVGAQMTSWVGGTPAANVKAKLKVIEADSAFDTLKTMREQSKTGGALGSVSEKELGLLASSRAALSQDLSPSEFKKELKKYQYIRKRSLERVKEAYLKDYGYLPDDMKIDNNFLEFSEKYSDKFFQPEFLGKKIKMKDGGIITVTKEMVR